MKEDKTLLRSRTLYKLNEIARMKSAEEGHIEADQLLLEFLRGIGEEDVANAWDEAEGECGFWYS